MLENETGRGSEHDLGRAEQLLGSKYNPYEVSDIFSYFKPEESKTMMDDLANRLEGQNDTEQDKIRSAWLKHTADRASQNR